MTTYLAITTLNAGTNGYQLLAFGDKKSDVKKAGLEQIGKVNVMDLNTTTLVTSMIVLSKSQAKRKGLYDFDNRIDVHGEYLI